MADIQKTAGIILTTRPFKESSLFVSILTRKFGRIKVVAKGCRRPRSKFCGALEPFSRCEIIFYRRELKDLYTLSDAAVIENYAGIRGSLTRVAAAQVMCEFLDKALPAEEPDDRVYGLLAEFLKNMATEPADKLRAIVLVCLVRGLAVAGIKPHLADCVRCRKPIPGRTAAVNFCVPAGGVICDAHPDETALRIRMETVNTMRHIYGERRLRISQRTIDDLLEIIPPYLAYHLNGLTLNALKHLTRQYRIIPAPPRMDSRHNSH